MKDGVFQKLEWAFLGLISRSLFPYMAMGSAPSPYKDHFPCETTRLAWFCEWRNEWVAKRKAAYYDLNESLCQHPLSIMAERNVYESLTHCHQRYGGDFKCALLQHIAMNNVKSISRNIALRWIPPVITDDKSTLVQVMAWCRQATSHYLSQYWPDGVTGPQWVNSLTLHVSLTAIIS